MIHLIICNIITIFLLKKLGEGFFNKRYKKKSIQIVITLFFIIIMCLINYKGTSNYKALILFFLYLSYLYIFYNCKISLSFSIGIVFFLIVTVSEIIIFLIINAVLEKNLILEISTFKYNLCLYFSSILTFIFINLFLKIKHIYNLSLLPKFSWLILLIPIITIIIFLNIENYNLLINNLVLFVIVYGLCFLNMIIGFVFLSIVSFINTQRETNILKQQEKLINDRYKLLEQHYENNFNFLHNILHMCTKINNLIENKKFDNLKLNLNNLAEETVKKFNLIYTNSVILNTLINNSLDEIIEKNISISVDIGENDLKLINFKEQFEILEYLFNISLNSCKIIKNTNKNIIFKSKKIKNHLIIQVAFPYNKNLTNDDLYDKNTHKNISSILDAYNTKTYITNKNINGFNMKYISIHFYSIKNINT